jgi:hypothetical protein
METIFSNVYHVITCDGDIIGHHFDDGIPWPEALSNQPYHANFEWEISNRVARTPVDQKVYLAVTPISIRRNGLAPYRGQNGDMSLPVPWDTYNFDHPNVKTAFVNHCERMISEFQPDYLAIGIEVNLLMANTPSNWNAYMDLHRHAYAAITNAHPDLPVFVSLTGMDLIEGYTSANHSNQMAAVGDVMPYSDFYGLSLHCFISSLLAEIVPTRELLREIMALSIKPVAICETSYPAEVFSINGGSLLFNGSPDKQRRYIENLVTVLDERDSRFVINFLGIDYDGLWDWMGQPDDISKLWRDTGLYDGNRAPRPALRIWKGKLFLPVAEDN